MRWQPAVRIAPPWHDDPVYIEAVAASLEAELAKLSFKPEVVLASFHGVPKDYLLKGDPYHCQCQKTARLLRARLGLDEKRFMLTFQSRFGTAEWLQPYTDMTVKALAERGVKEPRDRHAGIYRRLPGNAGRNRRRECRDLSPPRRQEFRRDSLPERQRGRNGSDLPRRAARAERLDRLNPRATECD